MAVVVVVVVVVVAVVVGTAYRIWQKTCRVSYMA